MIIVLSSEATSDSISTLGLVIWSQSTLTGSYSLNLCHHFWVFGGFMFHLFQHVLFIHSSVLFIVYYYPGV